MSSSTFQRLIIYFSVLHCCTPFLQGCQTQNSKPEPSLSSRAVTREKKDPTAEERLFNTMVDVFNEQKIKIKLKDEKSFLIVTEFRAIGTEIRQHFVARVFSTSKGLLFRIRSVYERLDRRTFPNLWIEQKTPSTFKRAYRDEQDLGEKIRARFE